MHRYSILWRAIISSSLLCFLLFFQVTDANDDNNENKKCISINVIPMGLQLYNHSTMDFYYLNGPAYEYYDGTLNYHVFDWSEDLLLSHNESSRVCYDSSLSSCHYIYLLGNGVFEITDEDDNLQEFRVYRGSPKLVEMGGKNCVNSCDKGQQQAVIAAETISDSIVYNWVVDPVTFDKMASNKTKGDAAVLKKMCFQSNDCYKLVGNDAAFIVKDGNTTIGEGSSGHGYAIFGNHCQYKCYDKPILVDTNRGQEIVLVLSGISGTESILDVDSPQYKAACWLIYDDRRQLTAANYNIVQRYILALLFFSLDGFNWKKNLNFLAPSHECQWRKSAYNELYGIYYDDGDGVHCNDAGDVSRIVLVYNNLAGKIPHELSWLLHLEILNLEDNFLQGRIPTKFGILANLNQLLLKNNALTGTLPQAIYSLTDLTRVSLATNQLTGTISNFAGDLTELNVENNYLTGTLPNEIGTLTSLRGLILLENFFTGTIPKSFDNLKELFYVNLGFNRFSGTVPSGIFELTNLVNVFIAHNVLTGSIPSRVAGDSNLNFLIFDSNRLSGTIPSELSTMENLIMFYVHHNQLTGQVPPALTQIESLIDFAVNDNHITGVVPFERCEQFIYMAADCDSPQKVVCPCCSNCDGEFVSYNRELSCASTELKVEFSDLNYGQWVYFMVYDGPQHAHALDRHYFLANDPNAEYTLCISILSCIEIVFFPWMVFPFGMKVFVDGEMVLEETITTFGPVNFGYSSNHIMQEGSCDGVELCNVTVQANSTQRGLINRLTRVTGTDVFEDESSPEFNAVCHWLQYIETRNNDRSELIQHYFLALLFFITNGDKWYDSPLWLTNESFCSWYGVSCDDYGLVTTINLSSNNLFGTIPAQIGELKGLENLVLNGNRLFGTIPSQIGLQLKNLKRLKTSYNRLDGTLPSGIVLLSDLVELDLSNNRLINEVPSQIGDVANLEILNLQNNSFSGEIPSSLYSLHKLRILSLGSNLLVGRVSKVKELRNLETIDLSNNVFTGSIPLSGEQNKLRVVRFFGNRFRGSIPASIGELQLLEELLLFNNQMTGRVPEQIGNLQNLVTVSMSYNKMKGEIPSEIGRLKNLTLLHFHNNRLTGFADHFDYLVPDYITDCGEIFAAEAMVECESCATCCTIEGDCINKNATWPTESISDLHIEATAFVFTLSLCFCLALIPVVFLIYYVARWKVSDFQLCKTFQEESVYKFFLSKNKRANFLACLTVLVQVMILNIFVRASDFTAPRNDWEYTLVCPENSDSCETRRRISTIGWLAFSVVVLCYLLQDILEGLHMIYESITLRTWRGILAGFVVIFYTVSSIVASTLYNFSTAVSDTDILKDAVILLFLNDLDEQIYGIMKLLCPTWVESEEEIISSFLDRRVKRHSLAINGVTKLLRRSLSFRRFNKRDLLDSSVSSSRGELEDKRVPSSMMPMADSKGLDAGDKLAFSPKKTRLAGKKVRFSEIVLPTTRGDIGETLECDEQHPSHFISQLNIDHMHHLITHNQQKNLETEKEVIKLKGENLEMRQEIEHLKQELRDLKLCFMKGPLTQEEEMTLDGGDPC